MKKISSLMILSLCAIVTACGRTGGNTSSSEDTRYKVCCSPYESLNGRLAREKYRSLTTVGIGSLNYLQTSAAQNASHFANFVDGLLTHNDFGTLELNLAESAKVNTNYTEFTFKIRDDENLYWSTYEGKPYEYNGQVQKVKASDFAYAAKVISTFSFKSDTFYLLRDFIKGAAEYYHYTEIVYKAAAGTSSYMKLNTNAKKAKYLNDTIQANYPSVWKAQYDEAEGGTPITADDIDNIANGSRLGVKADDSKNEVKYLMLQPARYFPTLLTYSAYLPINQHFYDEKKSKFGLNSPDAILYCGPYILTTLDETNIEYSRNEAYMKRKDVQACGYKAARIMKVHFDIVKGEIDNTFIRTQFENGVIDGFSLSPNDTEGWNKYVVGNNGKGNGTIENPDSGLVNSRWLDTIGECYGSNIVMNRSGDGSSNTSYYSKGSVDTIKNTEKALQLQDVRKMILDCIDYRTYYARYSDGIEDDVFATQKLVSTYVPKAFVEDDNGNEYTQEYYAQALADYKGWTKKQAQDFIAAGQYESRQLDWDASKDGSSERAQIDALVAKAKQAIADYNAGPGASDPITYPINLEMFSAWDNDQETKTYDTLFMNEMNKRLNGVDDPGVDNVNCNYFKVVPTDKIDPDNQTIVSGSDASSLAAYDFSVVNWGWGADYGDPLTYMNTYTRGGDWSSVFGFVGKDSVDSYRYNSSNQLVKYNLLEEYEDLVNEGKKQNDDLTSRFSYFAEAEVKLIEELAIYKPQVNYGQGWSLSISHSAGYEMPTANYGLSNDRMTGMWVLEEPLTREERASIRAEQEAAKAEWNRTHDAYNIYGN